MRAAESRREQVVAVSFSICRGSSSRSRPCTTSRSCRTLGLGPLLAIMQTLAYRTKDAKWERMVRFFGTLFLINFAIGSRPAWCRSSSSG
jgi:hypothetical protein